MLVTPVEVALHIAEHGWPVFPAGASKRPAIAGGNGFLDAVRIPVEIQALFSRAPHAALVGVPTGEISGFDVLDIDYRHNGGTWEQANSHRLPETRIHQSQSGGRHYLFKHAPGVRNSASKLAEGIDIRGDGGYVIAPPSTGYSVIHDVEIVDWPDWLLAIVLARKTQDEVRPSVPFDTAQMTSPRLEGFRQSLIRKVTAARDGEKHYTLRNAALSLGGICDIAGITEGEAVSMLIEALPASVQDRAGAFKTAEWGIRQGRQRPLQLIDRPEYTATQSRPFGFGYALNGQHHSAREAGDNPKEGDQTNNNARQSLFLTMRELDALPSPEWLVDGLIPEKALVVPFGPPKAGKTFVVLSWCIHVAAGIPWFGRTVKQGMVFYIIGEGFGGMSMRLRAMRQAYGIDVDAPFIIRKRAVNFQLAEEVDHLIDDIKHIAAGRSVAIVVVDTLARAMPGAEENSAKEVGLVIAACDKVREELDCAVVPVHHSGKDIARGARGTSALRGAWDTALEITGTGSRSVMTVADQKDAESGQRLVFKMEQVSVGIGRTSLVPMLDEGDHTEDQKAPRREPTGHPLTALTVLRNLLASADLPALPFFQGMPSSDVRGVHHERWRDAFYEKMPGETTAKRRLAFWRASQKLEQLGYVGIRDPWVWLA